MRISRTLGLGAFLLSMVACQMSSDMPMTPPPISASFDLQLQDIFAGKPAPNTPMDLQAPPGDPRLFIAERGGKILVAQSGTLLTAPFLDISSRVLPLIGEDGLLSFAFDPQYTANGFVYVHFIEKSVAHPNGEIVVERYQVSPSDPNVLQSPGAPVIRIAHDDATNHYGGHVFIGPDGMLYLSTGDGGGGGNQFHHAQDATSLLGKMLRLDVSSLPYAIPPDNPVWPGATQPNEIWAIGLRNPFRYAFDFPSGRLYIAEVGQGAREEVDVVDASAAGLNYGWSIMEGTLCFDGPCPTPGLTSPVYDYDHSQGCAIIGGYVYRGSAMPGFQGTYFFSDLCTGFLRGLTMQNGVATVVQAPNANAGTVFSFGQDGAGEIYILNASNQVLKIVRP